MRLDPTAVLAWALGSPPADFRFLGWLDTRSLPFPGQTDRVGDLVARVERTAPVGEPWLIAVEIQIEPDPLMFGRLLEYLGRLWRAEKPSPERGDRYRLASVVINLTGAARASQDFEWSAAGPRTLLRVAERNPSRESAAEVLSAMTAGDQPTALLPLIPLMRGGAEPGIIQAWLRLATAEPNSRRRSEYGALSVVFAEATGARDTWKEALRDWNMVESLQVLEWQEEARVQTQHSSVIDILVEKFGVAPPELAQQIRAVKEVPRLARMVVQAAKAASLDEFRAAAGL